MILFGVDLCVAPTFRGSMIVNSNQQRKNNNQKKTIEI